MNVRHSKAQADAIGADWKAGKLDREIMEAHGLTKGQLAGLVRRHGWKRPWGNLKTLSPRQQTIYKKLRRAQVGRVDAFEAVHEFNAASRVPSHAASGPMVGNREPASGPHLASASNSGDR